MRSCKECESGRAENLNKGGLAGNALPGGRRAEGHWGRGRGVKAQASTRAGWGEERGRRGGLGDWGTWQHGLLRGGIGIPQEPVTRVLFKGVHESMEVGQFVQLCDVIPVSI